jgi:hypothetical protein
MVKKLGEIRLRAGKDLPKAEKYIEEICDYYNIGTEYFANIMLSSSEGIGLLLAEAEKRRGELTLFASKISRGLRITAELKTKEPPQEDHDMIDQGLKMAKMTREMFIIKTLADDLRISKGGDKLELSYYITSLNSEKYFRRAQKVKEYFERTGVLIKKKNV